MPALCLVACCAASTAHPHCAPSLHPCAGPPFFNQVSAELIPQNDRTVKVRMGAGRQRDTAWYLTLAGHPPLETQLPPRRSPYLHLLPGSLHAALPLTPSPQLPSSSPKVQFKEFKILGLIPVKAPASAAGALEVTYLDEELRVSRGDRGNLFVLRMQDRRVKP